MHRKALALTGLTAVALAGGGIAVAQAATPSTPAAPAPTTAAAAKAHHRRAPLHAEAVRRGKGGFVTIGTQRGTITAVTPTSLTERSVDGFVRTYVLGPDTKVRVDKAASTVSALKVGEKASIAALQTGDTWTARRAVAHS